MTFYLLLFHFIHLPHRELDPESQHIEFGLFNDHTYADLQFRYTLPPNLNVPALQVDETVPDAAAIVTVKTEDESNAVKDAVKVEKAFDVKEVVVKQEVTDDKDEQEVTLTDELEPADKPDDCDVDVKEEEKEHSQVVEDNDDDTVSTKKIDRLLNI